MMKRNAEISCPHYLQRGCNCHFSKRSANSGEKAFFPVVLTMLNK